MTGSITYAKDDLGKKVDSYNFKYILLDSNSKKSTGNNISSNSEKSKLDEFNEGIRDLKVQLLGKMDNETAEKLYEKLQQEYSEHLPFHTAYLQVIDPLDVKRSFPTKSIKITKEDQNKIISVCDKAIENISEDTLLAFSAMKIDLRADASKIKT